MPTSAFTFKTKTLLRHYKGADVKLGFLWLPVPYENCINVLNVKVLVGTLNQKKALVEAFSVIV